MQATEIAVDTSLYASAPQVLLPYPGCGKENEQDIFLLLRPEKNNYQVESLILSTFRESCEYKKTIFIQYLANISGSFIEKTKFFHKHYATKFFFAKHNKDFFSAYMKKSFENHFSQNIADCEVLGAFEASKRLHLSFEELFHINVPYNNILRVSGQIIKKIFDKNKKAVYVINSDIPALLSREYSQENCAVIMFRTTLSYDMFNQYIHKVYEKLIHSKIIFPKNDDEYDVGIKKVFRYSRGPFEQLRDSIEFLYHPNRNNVSIADMTFARYLYEKGVSYDTMVNLLLFPICHVSTDDTLSSVENSEERTIFECTKYATYEQAYAFLYTLRDQRLTRLS